MITSGFFPSVNGDRKYANSFLAQWVHSFISDGVYNGSFAVTAGENMNVIIPPGQAWINGYYCRNDGNITLPIANADGMLKRKDTIVLRWDINTRNITVQVLTGAFSSNPVAPAIVRNAEQYDLKLAEISIAAGAISITQSMIMDTRLDNNVCGIVHAVVDHIDTTTLFNQLQAYMVEHEAQFTADMAAFKTQSGADFSTWFNGIKDVLGKDEAGNLLNLINSHTTNPTIHTNQAEKDAWNAKANKSDIPTSLPANGGHAASADSAGYANSAGSAPANGGTSAACSGNSATAGVSNYAHYSSHAVGSGGAALRNITMSTGGPSGGQDGDVWHQYK